MRALSTSTLETIFHFDITSGVRLLEVGPEVVELLGFPRELWLKGSVDLRSLIHADDSDLADLLFCPAPANGEMVLNLRVRQANGLIRCCKAEYRKAIESGACVLRLLLRDAKSLPRTLSDAALTANLRAVMENTNDFVYFKDRNHVFTGASQTLVSISDGVSHWTDFLGLTDYDVFPEALADAYYRLEKQVFIGNAVAREVQPIQTVGGQPGWVDNRKYPIHNEQGEIIGLFGVARDITESVEIENRLQTALEQRERLAKHVPGVLYQFRLRPDGSTHFPYASQGLREIYGVAPEAVTDDATPVYQVLHPDDLSRVSQSIMESARTLTLWHDEYRVCVPGRRTIWVEGEATPEPQADGSVLWHGYIRDVTERRHSDEALRRAASVFTFAREGIIITDHEARIVEVNQAFTDITGYTRDEALGRNPNLLNSGRQDRAFYAAMWEELLSQGHWSGEMWNRRKDGSVMAELLTVSAVRDANGDVRNYIGLFSDITSIKEHQGELERMAHYDSLTSLPNRLLLADRLRQSMAQAPRRGQSLAVVYLDLDEFKGINDAHGHEVGDQLLVAIAHRIEAVLRDGDTVSRIGGDEFVAVLLDLGDARSAHTLFSRLIEAAAQPVTVGDRVIQVTASMGVTFYPQQQTVDADQLLRQADQAMYQAKQAGKNRFHVFDTEQDFNVRQRFEQIERIRQAKTNGELVLYYQPKVNMRTGQVLGAEALIRWRHPELGLLAPSKFLPAIENHSLFISVGQWVIESALAQMRAWQQMGLDVPVSVNVGAMQLQDPDFVGSLRELLARYPSVNPRSLQLEVLETSAIDAYAKVSQLIRECQAMGVSFALDDFGTGYSSLTYLKQLPAELLKIDQSFVRGMLDDPEDLAIVEGVLGLTSAFRRAVIAEGVETLAHGELLLRLGCEQGQGYAIARPMPANELPDWLASWQTPDAWQDLAPVRRELLPVLIAMADHRTWMQRMLAYLEGLAADIGELDVQHCRFGRWLGSDANGLITSAEELETIRALHEEVHDVAKQLTELKRAGRSEKLQLQIDSLKESSERLMSRLVALC